jgi:hypothetical protein
MLEQRMQPRSFRMVCLACLFAIMHRGFKSYIRVFPMALMSSDFRTLKENRPNPHLGRGKRVGTRAATY